MKVLQKMRCKGGTPMPMSVSEDMLLTTRLDRSSKNAANKVGEKLVRFLLCNRLTE